MSLARPHSRPKGCWAWMSHSPYVAPRRKTETSVSPSPSKSATGGCGEPSGAVTVTVIVSQSERSPSETHTSKCGGPTWALLGVQVKSPPLSDRGARGHRAAVPAASEKVSASRSGSLAVAVKASSRAGGGVLVAHQVQGGGGVDRGHGDGDRLAVGEVAVGDAHIEGVAAPALLGVQVKSPPLVIEAPAGTEPTCRGEREGERRAASGSLAVAVKASSVPAVAFLSPTRSRVGAAFTAATVTVIVSQSERSPSETHTSKVCGPPGRRSASR